MIVPVPEADVFRPRWPHHADEAIGDREERREAPAIQRDCKSPPTSVMYRSTLDRVLHWTMDRWKAPANASEAYGLDGAGRIS